MTARNIFSRAQTLHSCSSWTRQFHRLGVTYTYLPFAHVSWFIIIIFLRYFQVIAMFCILNSWNICFEWIILKPNLGSKGYGPYPQQWGTYWFHDMREESSGYHMYTGDGKVNQFSSITAKPTDSLKPVPGHQSSKYCTSFSKFKKKMISQEVGLALYVYVTELSTNTPYKFVYKFRYF